jgi:nucleoside-diphosphate-sugar epimerase
MINNKLHIVVGGSGPSGRAIIKELKSRNLQVKSLGRTKTKEEVESIQADIFNLEEYKKAVEGASYIYLAIGLPYNTKYWEKNWPLVMENTIEAVKSTNAKLIFLDNIYMYSEPLPNFFDETTSEFPKSKKGLVRKKTANTLLEAIKSKKVQALIGRSATFYGPNCKNSFLYSSFLEKMLEGKQPQSLFKTDQVHTYANITDNAKALVELALNDTCYGEVWHLPVGEPISLNEILTIINSILNKNFKISVMPKFLFTILSFIIPILGELKEMMYQMESPYIMSWQKFKNKFPNFKVTNYEQGLKEMINSFH